MLFQEVDVPQRLRLAAEAGFKDVEILFPWWHDLDAIERDMQTNYFGTLAVTRSLLPAIERGRGAVANILTVAALASMPFLGGYSASKAAALSFTQALRGELGRRGLQVFAVFPGPVDTDMGRDIVIEKTPAADVARRAALQLHEPHCAGGGLGVDAIEAFLPHHCIYQ